MGIDDWKMAEATIDTILSSLVFVYFGAPLQVQDQEKRRMDLVREIEESVGSQVGILHGSRRWLIGTYGGIDRFNVGAVAPEIPELIRQVLEMKMGEVQEV